MANVGFNEGKHLGVNDTCCGFTPSVCQDGYIHRMGSGSVGVDGMDSRKDMWGKGVVRGCTKVSKFADLNEPWRSTVVAVQDDWVVSLCVGVSHASAVVVTEKGACLPRLLVVNH
jgi:hypothetical protein